MERGCYIVLSTQLGTLPEQQVYWHINAYQTRAEAEVAKGPHGSVVEALGRIWLMNIGNATYRAPGGEHVGRVGPLATHAGVNYTAAYMEGIMLPGAETGIHHHPGPEAIFTLAGEECMETETDKLSGRAGGTPIIVPAGVQHKLTIVGTVERRSLALVLHDSSQPWAIRTHAHSWTPKGLCKVG